MCTKHESIEVVEHPLELALKAAERATRELVRTRRNAPPYFRLALPYEKG